MRLGRSLGSLFLTVLMLTSGGLTLALSGPVGQPALGSSPAPIAGAKVGLPAPAASMDTVAQTPPPIQVNLAPVANLYRVPLPEHPGAIYGPIDTERNVLFEQQFIACDDSFAGGARSRTFNDLVNTYPREDVSALSWYGNFTVDYGSPGTEDLLCDAWEPGLEPGSDVQDWWSHASLRAQTPAPVGADDGSDHLRIAICEDDCFSNDLAAVPALSVDAPLWDDSLEPLWCTYQDYADTSLTAPTQAVIDARLSVPTSYSLTLDYTYDSLNESGTAAVHVQALDFDPTRNYGDLALNLFITDDYDVVHAFSVGNRPDCSIANYNGQMQIRHAIRDWSSPYGFGFGDIQKGDVWWGMNFSFDHANSVPSNWGPAWNANEVYLVAALQHEDEVLQATTVKVDTTLPDLAVFASNISFTIPAPNVTDVVTIDALITNVGNAAALADIHYFDGDPTLGGSLLGIDSGVTVAAHSTASSTWIWDTTGQQGDHNIVVYADFPEAVVEYNEKNNLAGRDIYVAPSDDVGVPCPTPGLVCVDNIVDGGTIPVGDMTIDATPENLGQQGTGASFLTRFTVDQTGIPNTVCFDDFDGGLLGTCTWVDTQNNIDGPGSPVAILDPPPSGTLIGYVGQEVNAAWVTPPGYGHDALYELALQTVDLSGYIGATLSLWVKHDSEAGYDFPIIEVQGVPTTQLYSGATPVGVWTQHSFDLTPWVGQTVTLTFQQTSDGAWDDEDGIYDGWGFGIDDVEVIGYSGGAGVVCGGPGPGDLSTGPLVIGASEPLSFACAIPSAGLYDITVESGYLGFAGWAPPGGDTFTPDSALTSEWKEVNNAAYDTTSFDQEATTAAYTTHSAGENTALSSTSGSLFTYSNALADFGRYSWDASTGPTWTSSANVSQVCGTWDLTNVERAGSTPVEMYVWDFIALDWVLLDSQTTIGNDNPVTVQGCVPGSPDYFDASDTIVAGVFSTDNGGGGARAVDVEYLALQVDNGLCVGGDDYCRNNRQFLSVLAVDVSVEPPTNLTVANVTADVDLTWTLSADDGGGLNDVVGYEVFRALALNGPWVSIANLSIGTATFTDTDNGSGPNLWYRVEAIDSSDNRGSSGSVSKYNFLPETFNLRANGQNGFLSIPQGTPNVTIQLAVVDDTSLTEAIPKLSGGEYVLWDNGLGPFVEPGEGNGIPLVPLDTTWDTDGEVIQPILIDTSGWGIGANYTFYTRGLEDVGWNSTGMGDPASAQAVTIAIPDYPPVACADDGAGAPLFQAGPAPLAAVFDASCSSDSEGPIAAYWWTFVDPMTGSQNLSGANPAYLFTGPGNVTVTLWVQDGSGQLASLDLWVNVSQLVVEVPVTLGLNSWNLISHTIANYPPTDVRAVYDDSVFGDGGETITAFYRWANGSWLSHFDARPAFLNDLIMVAGSDGGAVWANLSTSSGDGVISVSTTGGTLFGPAGAGGAASVVPGWQIIGYLAATNQTFGGFIGANPMVIEVWEADPFGPHGLGQLGGADLMVPGQAYWIESSSAGVAVY